MHGGDRGVAHIATPVEPGDLILLDDREYRITDVILLEDEQSPLMRSYGLSQHMYDR